MFAKAIGAKIQMTFPAISGLDAAGFVVAGLGTSVKGLRGLESRVIRSASAREHWRSAYVVTTPDRIAKDRR